ncbi:MAG TPA: ABC transporter ATP-binding protein [Acidobacteria bacterium]|nr:ABC transporter ATP-binding protein [Acidobacteriota bacterium]
MSLLRLLRAALRPYRPQLLGVVVFQLVATMASLFLPSLNADIIDLGVTRGDTGYITRSGLTMLVVALVQIGGTATAVYFGARTAMGVGRDLRSAVFRQVGTFSSREVAHFGAPSLITRCTNDVQQVQMVVLMACTMMASAPIMMTGGVAMAVREDAGLSWLLMVAVPAMVLSLGFVIVKVMPAFRAMQRRIDAVNKTMREQIIGIRVVRAFVREPFETARFGRVNRDLTGIALFVGRWMAAMFPVVILILNASSVAVLWFGAQRVDAGVMQIGSLTAFLAYLIQILVAVMMATFMLMMVPRAAVAADRMTEVLDTDSTVVPPSSPVLTVSERATVRFDNVSFSYPGASHAVLQEVSLVAEPGKTTAIIGSTGAGKTTLLSLIPRLFDVTAGQIVVDGVDVRQLDPDLLWSRIGLVPQKGYLFSGTVASNLRHGRPDATDAELWAALDTAQARVFVEKMPKGLETSIAQGGTNVSGGQRQRLAIARAVLREPEIYLFDDAFSALDLATDARVRQALRPLTNDAAVLVVAQRVSSIVDADQILVLEDGQIVGRGTHSALLDGCTTYQEIVESQGGPEHG